MFIKGLRDRIAGRYQNFTWAEGDKVEGFVGLGFDFIRDEGNLETVLFQRIHGAMDQALRPGNGQIVVRETQHTHQVHGSEGQVNLNDSDTHLVERAGDLGNTLVVGAQSAPDDEPFED